MFEACESILEQGMERLTRQVNTFGQTVNFFQGGQTKSVNQGGNAGNSRPCFWGREFFIFWLY